MSTRIHPSPQQKEAQKVELEILRLASARERIRLKYWDEAEFSLWSPVSYTYIKVRKQKVIPQSKKKGKRLNI